VPSWVKLIVDPKLKGNARAYLAQCGLATLALLVVLTFQDAFENAVIIAAVASTLFVLFITPHAIMCTPRRVVGGHMVGLLLGSLVGFFLASGAGEAMVDAVPYSFELFAALGVGLSILIMAFTNTEHGPAAGTALGFVVLDFRWALVLVLLGSVVILSLVHQLALQRMRNLL